MSLNGQKKATVSRRGNDINSNYDMNDYEKAAEDFLYTAAGQRNRNHTAPFVRFEGVPFSMEEVLYDPQTSGGLLFAVDPADANELEQELQQAGLAAKIVGEILDKTDPEIIVTY